MNTNVPKRDILIGQRNGPLMHLVYLDPARYTPTELLYIAARTTRVFTEPDETLANAPAHLSTWLQGTPNPHWVGGSDRLVHEAMHSWLRTHIVRPRHDSVLEFAGTGAAVWVGGVSIATWRDVRTHRHHSFECYTTRALGKELAEHLPDLDNVNKLTVNEVRWDRLKELFYIHPGREALEGHAEVASALRRYAGELAYYIRRTQAGTEEGKRAAADIYRSDIPMALKVPGVLASNGRGWAEAIGKRTCAREGHIEYATLFKGLGLLLQPVLPFLGEVACRWCPQGEPPERCCRTTWAAEMTENQPLQTDLTG